MVEVKTRILILMAQQNITRQSHLAQMAGVSNNCIHYLMKGVVPKREQLERISSVLLRTPEELTRLIYEGLVARTKGQIESYQLPPEREQPPEEAVT